MRSSGRSVFLTKYVSSCLTTLPTDKRDRPIPDGAQSIGEEVTTHVML